MKKLIFTLALLLATMLPNISFALIEEWVARYPGMPRSIAIDTWDNIYVSGYSYDSGEPVWDYATIKYDSSGNQLWVARYNGGYWDNDIAVDSLGNVYLTGNTSGDYVTIKYDTNGNELWAVRYNGPSNGYDAAYAIALDYAGNVYVTGDSSGISTASDYTTIKYDSLGNQLWVARYNGLGPSGSSWDFPHAITVDFLGNVYVTGRSMGSSNDYDYATIKYDTNGNQLWVARYKGTEPGGNRYDEATAIAVDSSGNVYVTGYSGGSIAYDYATIKYDSLGNAVWVRRYNNGQDIANAIALDSLGNVYVTGSSTSIGTDDDYTTIKYDSNGNQIWVARYNDPSNQEDEASAIILDSSNNVYVTGRSEGIGTLHDYATVKYDTNGNELWAVRYNGPWNYEDEALNIILDSSNNIYVTGASGGEYATIKYRQTDYSSSTFLLMPPIKDDGTSVFKLNSTIPIKFQLIDEGGAFISTAIAKLILQRYSDTEPIGEPIDATPTGNADSGNLFRYVETDNQYIFNLNTKSLSIGTWLLQVILDDGTTRSIFIGLK